MIQNEMRRRREQMSSLHRSIQDLENNTKYNEEKIKRSCQLPYLVANIGEILEIEDELDKKEGSGMQQSSSSKPKPEEKKKKNAVVLKTTNR